MNNSFPFARVVPWAAPLTILVAAVVANVTFGAALTVLVLAAGAFLLVIFLLWSSVQALTGESELTFEEAFSLGTRSAEEEQKRAVLRALKDLEYERSVGKISEEDFHEYSARYRAEAKRLIQSLDENLSEGRKQVERELDRRVAKADSNAAAAEVTATSEATATSTVALTNEAVESPESTENSDEIAESAADSEAPATRLCSACQTKNELDARFCKSCGKSMSASEEAES